MSLPHRTISADLPTTETGPYPSWSTMSRELGRGNNSGASECQTLKEARLWRALAEEDGTDDPTLQSTESSGAGSRSTRRTGVA